MYCKFYQQRTYLKIVLFFLHVAVRCTILLTPDADLFITMVLLIFDIFFFWLHFVHIFYFIIFVFITGISFIFDIFFVTVCYYI